MSSREKRSVPRSPRGYKDDQLPWSAIRSLRERRGHGRTVSSKTTGMMILRLAVELKVRTVRGASRRQEVEMREIRAAAVGERRDMTGVGG